MPGTYQRLDVILFRENWSISIAALKNNNKKQTKALNPTDKVQKAQAERDETTSWNVAKYPDPIFQTFNFKKTKLPTTSPFILNMWTISKKKSAAIHLSHSHLNYTKCWVF